ncbi:hypothetical protein [Spirosoma sp. KNUC1025]|uniref:hypothetical protein n=1 Tax=Spirosoma sp. KNUC1025 TaxID=2894082 RepID=UPI003865EA07|nr:hypothetical protein LN737_25265 [Spirosoma sp. KNUC1025]
MSFDKTNIKTLNTPSHFVGNQACDTLVYTSTESTFSLDLRYQDNGNISSFG